MTKERLYNLPCSWREFGRLLIGADSLEEAIASADEAPLPKGEYAEGSFQIDEDFLLEYAEGNGYEDEVRAYLEKKTPKKLYHRFFAIGGVIHWDRVDGDEELEKRFLAHLSPDDRGRFEDERAALAKPGGWANLGDMGIVVRVS